MEKLLHSTPTLGYCFEKVLIRSTTFLYSQTQINLVYFSFTALKYNLSWLSQKDGKKLKKKSIQTFFLKKISLICIANFSACLRSFLNFPGSQKQARIYLPYTEKIDFCIAFPIQKFPTSAKDKQKDFQEIMPPCLLFGFQIRRRHLLQSLEQSSRVHWRMSWYWRWESLRHQ